MQEKAKWMELCEQAANEQDPQKLQALIAEICALLADKERRLERQVASGEVVCSGSKTARLGRA
jgi:hypothetical protein